MMPIPRTWILLSLVAAGLGAGASAHAFVAYQPRHKLPIEKVVTLREDLDGDGAADEVRIEFCRKADYSSEYVVVRCAGDELVLLGEGVVHEASVVDIDTTDCDREILLSEEGPSDDPALALIALRAGRLRMLGAIDGGAHPNGDGTLSASTRGRVLQTWWYPQTFVLSPDDTLVAVERRMYPMRTPVQLLVDLPLVRGAGDPRPALVLREGDSAVLWASDDREWVLVRAGRCAGWFRLGDDGAVAAVGLEPQSVFSGLSLVD